MSVIFVTHDIGVAIEICDRVAVMYAGQIVEQGKLSQIVRTPIHPYARGLLASTVHGAKRGQRLETIPGTPPSLDKAPVNCSFAPRCTFAQPRCIESLPPNVEIASGRYRALHPGRTRDGCASGLIAANSGRHASQFPIVAPAAANGVGGAPGGAACNLRFQGPNWVECGIWRIWAAARCVATSIVISEVYAR